MPARGVVPARGPACPARGKRCATAGVTAMVAPAPAHDHLIGAGEHRLRNCQAKLLGRVEIDDQREPRRALDRQVGRLGTSENPADIDGAGLLLVRPTPTTLFVDWNAPLSSVR